jgi:hypothetical protein
MMRAASANSWRVWSWPPEMLISTPRAPWMEVSSSSGEEIARPRPSGKVSPIFVEWRREETRWTGMSALWWIRTSW